MWTATVRSYSQQHAFCQHSSTATATAFWPSASNLAFPLPFGCLPAASQAGRDLMPQRMAGSQVHCTAVWWQCLPLSVHVSRHFPFAKRSAKLSILIGSSKLKEKNANLLHFWLIANLVAPPQWTPETGCISHLNYFPIWRLRKLAMKMRFLGCGAKLG